MRKCKSKEDFVDPESASADRVRSLGEREKSAMEWELSHAFPASAWIQNVFDYK